jgi:phosphatidylinositol alpha-mannosyltransferase
VIERARPLRIAMISYYLPSGSKIGVGYQAHTLANGLVGRGHDVTMFSGCAPSEGALYRTVQVPAPRSLRTFAFARSIRRIDLSGFDVLHAHGDDYWLWRRRVPVHVRTMHGSCFEEALRVPGAKEKLRMVLLGLGETLATAVADRTVLVSPQTRRWMPWVRTVVPNGVNDHLLTPSRNSLRHVPTILFVGTYSNRKRGRLLMEVFAREIRPQLPEAQLVMVCSDAPAAPGVFRTGRITDQELADWYNRAWAFCLPSTYEGFGIPYAEALTAGLPVVATPNVGARYVIGDSGCGLLVPDHELGSALIRILSDEKLRASMREKALQRSRRYRLSAVLDQYEELYRDLGAGKAPSSRSSSTSDAPAT